MLRECSSQDRLTHWLNGLDTVEMPNPNRWPQPPTVGPHEEEAPKRVQAFNQNRAHGKEDSMPLIWGASRRRLDGIDLSRMSLAGSFWGCSLVRVTFRASNLCILTERSFRNRHDDRLYRLAEHMDTAFARCLLEEVTFDAANLPFTFFEACSLTRATFRKTTGIGRYRGEDHRHRQTFMDCEATGALFEDLNLVEARTRPVQQLKKGLIHPERAIWRRCRVTNEEERELLLSWGGTEITIGEPGSGYRGGG